MAHPYALIVGALALSAAWPALAVRPFITEDAGVLESGKCEFEASFGRSKQRGAVRQSRWWLQPVCGLGGRTQLALGTGAESGGGLRTSGITALAKTWLTTPSDQGLNLALAYGASTAKAPGQGWRHDSKLVNLVGTWKLGSATLGANLGWLRDVPAKRTSTTWSLGIEHPIGEGLDVGFDVFGDDREAPAGNLGLRWTVHEGLWLDAAYARQFNAARAQALNVGLRLGW